MKLSDILIKPHFAFSSFQFFSTLFAPLGFFADKMESFMPSSFWHQLTQIWPPLTHICTHTRRTKRHTNTTPNTQTKSVCSPVFSITVNLLHCYWLCWLRLYQHGNTTLKMLSHIVLVVRAFPRTHLEDTICSDFIGPFFCHCISMGQFKSFQCLIMCSSEFGTKI